MKHLLDTHTFIWMESDPDKLSSIVSTAIRDLNNTLLLSTASVWEIQIKTQTGKLKFPRLASKIAARVQMQQIQILPIELEHIFAIDQLPLLNHRDPFDRLLVAQALYQNWPILSHDPLIAQYPITTIW